MKHLLLGILTLYSIGTFGQENENQLKKVARVNFLSPGIELEIPISKQSLLTANAGIGISGSYPNLSFGDGFIYYTAPFLDLSYKRPYNREKRSNEGKNIQFNAANYYGIRLNTNFKEFASHNLLRTDNIDFAVGPTWGMQRAYGKFHMLFDLGPVYYFDTKGKHGFWPLMAQINIGWNLKEW